MVLTLNSILALPSLSDFHKSSLELYSSGRLADDGRFAIKVKREDHLVDKSEKIADRFVEVIVKFDVSTDGKLMVNGVHVPMGLHNIKVEAVTVTKIYTKSAKSHNMDKATIKKAFDIGLVSLDIKAVTEKVTVGGMEIIRLTLVEKITQISGKVVKQSKVMQQIFDIHGVKITRNPPSIIDSSNDLAHLLSSVHHDSHSNDKKTHLISHIASKIAHGCRISSAVKWLHEQSPLVRLLVILIFGGFFALTLVVVGKLFSLMFINVSEEPLYVKGAVLFSAVRDEDYDLPAYTNAVGTKEKK